MENISLGELDIVPLSSFKDIRHIVMTALWPKIYSEAVSCVHDKFKDSPEKRAAAFSSLKALQERSKKNARLFSKNAHHAGTLQNQVASNKDSLVVKAINRVYPRNVDECGPWDRRQRKRGLMQSDGLNDLTSVFQKLTPLLRKVKDSAGGSFFEHIPYICYVVVIVALIKDPDAQTAGWWEDRQNAICLARWAHEATKHPSLSVKIWSGIDLLLKAQHLVYCFCEKDANMLAAAGYVNRITNLIERHSNDSSQDDTWLVAYYNCSEVGMVDKLIALVNDIDPASGEEMRIRYTANSGISGANVNSQNNNASFSGVFLDMRRDAAKLWMTIVAEVEKAKADEEILSALKKQRQARHFADDGIKTTSVQGLANHLAEGLRFGLLLHNGAELIQKQVNMEDGVNLFLDRIDGRGELRVFCGQEAFESENE